MPAIAFHLYTCKKLFERLKLSKKSFEFHLMLIGSVIVDLDEVGVLQAVHGRSREFYHYLLKHEPKYAPLGIGMILHEELDKLVDIEYVHPNEPHAITLLNHYSKSFSQISLAGHYLLDLSLDGALLEQEPSMREFVDAVQKKLRPRHAKKIAKHLSHFFGANYDTVHHALLTFKDFNVSRFMTKEGLGDLWTYYMILKSRQQAYGHTEHTIGFFKKMKSSFSLGLTLTKYFFWDNPAKRAFEKARTTLLKNREQLFAKSHNVIERTFKRIKADKTKDSDTFLK